MIQAWFSDRGGEIAETFKYEEFEAVRQSLFASGETTYNGEKLRDEEQIFVRYAAFWQNVVKLYDQRYTFWKVQLASWEAEMR